jgi:CMP-N-acetylneuraminic acid synthetase
MSNITVNTKVVAFVPIRLNSKRIISKNIKKLGDKLLMEYILETLVRVSAIDEIYVYASSENIIPYLPEKIVFLRRSEQLDRDETLGGEIYDAFTSEIDAGIYILAHTTSPFIRYTTIENALNQMLEKGYDSVFSAEKIQTFAWYKGKPLNYDIKDIPKTQDMAPVFIETSGFYMFEHDIWCVEKQRIGHNPYMQIVDAVEGIDIDYPEDFEMAEKILSGGGGGPPPQ